MIAKTFLWVLMIIPITIQESPIIAEIVEDCKIYSDKTLNFPIGELYAGCFAEILEDFSMETYKVAERNFGAAGWVLADYLKIPPDAPTDESVLTQSQLESFVNSGNHTSKTDFLILTDISRQKTHVFIGAYQNWTLLKTLDCSTGLNVSPTTRGTFVIADRGSWFYSERLAAGAKHWMRFNGQYLFHSIPMDKNQNIIPGEDIVGVKRSSGCIRLMPDDAKWIYNTVPDGSAVVIV